MILLATLAITAGLFIVPASAQQATPKAPEHSMPMPPSGGMMNHAKMMSDMKAADARLEALLQTMKSASSSGRLIRTQPCSVKVVIPISFRMHSTRIAYWIGFGRTSTCFRIRGG
jgi:hypothetical protein